jgi:hypothetical protein
VLDLLSVHLIRHVDGSTIISFHPEIDHPITTAEYLHERIRFAGGFGFHSLYVALPELDQDKACIGRVSSKNLPTLRLCF